MLRFLTLVLVAMLAMVGLVVGAAFLAGAFAPKSPTHVEEDSPEFDCRIHGNMTCGVVIEGVTYLVEFEDGEPVSVKVRGED